MKKKPAMELVAALRSGKYRQTKGKLHGGSNTYCCLGVACAVSGVGKYEKLSRSDRAYVYTGPSDELFHEDMELPIPVRDHFGFSDCLGRRKDEKNLIFGTKEHESLANANDAGIKFTEIADYIEKNWRYL